MSIEKGSESTCTFAIADLSTKTLSLHNFEVIPVKDLKKNWALFEFSTRSGRYADVLKLDSDEIKKRIGKIFDSAQVFVVRNQLTLNILSDTFEICKSKIYVVNKSFPPDTALFCANCHDYIEYCVIHEAIGLTNFICNLNPSFRPPGLEVAQADEPFKFKALVNSQNSTVAIKTAQNDKCVRYNISSAGSDEEDG